MTDKAAAFQRDSDNADKLGNFSDYVGLTPLRHGPGYSEIELLIEPHHHNRLGIAHGGAILSALDLACGLSLVDQGPDKEPLRSMTINLNTNFVAPIRHGRLIVAGKLIRAGNSVAFCEAEATSDGGRLIARAQGTFKIIRDKHRETRS